MACAISVPPALIPALNAQHLSGHFTFTTDDPVCEALESGKYIVIYSQGNLEGQSLFMQVEAINESKTNKGVWILRMLNPKL